MIAHAWEWVLGHEHYNDSYDAKGNCKQLVANGKITSASSTPKLVSQPSRLEFYLSNELKEVVKGATEHAKGLCNDLQLVVDCYCTKNGGYGKGFIKVCASNALLVAVRCNYGASNVLLENVQCTSRGNFGPEPSVCLVSCRNKSFRQMLGSRCVFS